MNAPTEKVVSFSNGVKLTLWGLILAFLVQAVAASVTYGKLTQKVDSMYDQFQPVVESINRHEISIQLLERRHEEQEDD